MTCSSQSLSTAGSAGIAFSIVMIAALAGIMWLIVGIKRKQQELEFARFRSEIARRESAAASVL